MANGNDTAFDEDKNLFGEVGEALIIFRGESGNEAHLVVSHRDGSVNAQGVKQRHLNVSFTALVFPGGPLIVLCVIDDLWRQTDIDVLIIGSDSGGNFQE